MTQDRVNATLRITVEEAPKTASLRLEGRVAGPSVNAFQQAWHSLAASLGTRSLVVDLRGVTHMDATAREVLAEIHHQTNAEILTSSLMTQYFADEARGRTTRNTNKEN